MLPCPTISEELAGGYGDGKHHRQPNRGMILKMRMFMRQATIDGMKRPRIAAEQLFSPVTHVVGSQAEHQIWCALFGVMPA